MTAIEIRIELKKGVADPEGANTKKTLVSLGFGEVQSVKSVKVYRVEVDLPADEAVKAGEEYCRRLLANPVIQSYKVVLGRFSWRSRIWSRRGTRTTTSPRSR